MGGPPRGLLRSLAEPPRRRWSARSLLHRCTTSKWPTGHNARRRPPTRRPLHGGLRGPELESPFDWTPSEASGEKPRPTRRVPAPPPSFDRLLSPQRLPPKRRAPSPPRRTRRTANQSTWPIGCPRFGRARSERRRGHRPRSRSHTTPRTTQTRSPFPWPSWPEPRPLRSRRPLPRATARRGDLERPLRPVHPETNPASSLAGPERRAARSRPSAP